MQRARRLASIAVVAVTAVAGLSACRTEPDVAAYIGKSTITGDRVDAVYADAQRKLDAAVHQARAQQSAAPDPSAPPIPPDVKLAITRGDVLTALIGADLLGRIAKASNVKPAEVQAAQVAQQLQLPADAEYVGLYVQYRGYLSALINTAPVGKPTNADMQSLYDRLKAGGALGAEPISYKQFAAGLSAQETDAVSRSVGLRDKLAAEIKKENVSVNPRFGVEELPLLPVVLQTGKSINAIGVPLSSGGAAVVDGS